MLSGDDRICLRSGSRLHAIYGTESAREGYFCNYEVNPDYEARFEASGLPIVARGPQNEVRAVELPANRFFFATLYQPQLSSTSENPHPLILAFLQAAAQAAD